jgi:cell division protein FtsW
MFVGRIPAKFLLYTVFGGIFLFFIFIQGMKLMDVEGRRGTWSARIDNYIHPDDENVNNYQVNLAKVAIVNGGIIGKGPGNSIQKEKLPQANSDFIYAIMMFPSTSRRLTWKKRRLPARWVRP